MMNHFLSLAGPLVRVDYFSIIFGTKVAKVAAATFPKMLREQKSFIQAMEGGKGWFNR